MSTITNKMEIQRTDESTWVDVTSYLSKARINLGDVRSVGTKGGADGVAKKLDFTIRNDDDNNFAPRDRDSSWNQFSGSYAPLIWPNRKVRFISNVDGVDNILFKGYITDRINTERHQVSAGCTDLSYVLRHRHIETVRGYGSDDGTRVDVVLQNIMDDVLEADAPDLYMPAEPSFAVKTFEQELYHTVWDALQEKVNQFGWFIGYRYIESLGAFRLTLMEPPRDKSARNYDWLLTPENNYIRNDLEISASDVRNVITVIYQIRNDTLEEGFRNFVTVESADSIEEYGRHIMIIEEADSSQIDTVSEAMDFAESALADLHSPSAATNLEMPFFPEIQLFDGIVIADDDLTSTGDFFGVESIQHTIDFERAKYRTVIQGGQLVVGGRKKWLEMDARVGIKNPTTGEQIVSNLSVPVPSDFSVTDSGVEKTDLQPTAWVKFGWTRPDFQRKLSSYVIQIRPASAADWDSPRTYLIDASEKIMTTTVILPDNTDYEARALAVGRIGIQSDWSDLVSFTTPTDTTDPDQSSNIFVDGTIQGDRKSVV